MEETRNVWENEELLNIVTVGHVDHGKSTVIGRLLADAGALPKGKLESIRENCRRNSKPFEYAFLLDALHNEQDQGITIDTARCFFKSDKRRYIIIDAPGHIEFLKNMVTGASRAEAALMVIDAARGVEENTRRHGYFLSMLGIRQVAVLVNKMDLVGYSEEVYRSIGTYLGHALAYYYDLYHCKHVLLLGRVMSGKGGDLILEEAKRVLADEYPECDGKLFPSLPDEKTRRVGQSAAAASLPEV
mgnify:CR=1 FL=1